MREKASIRFQHVRKCGLCKQYARGVDIGNYSQVVGNIFNWVNSPGKLIQNTCTYQVSPNSNLEFLETYVMSMEHEKTTGDYFLALWNRTHRTGDSVYGLDPAASTNNLTSRAFRSGKLPARSIPGFATYFWLIPERSALATITFSSLRTGMRAFSYWLEQFIRTESRYAVFSGPKFLGYKNTNGQLRTDVEPKFERSLYANPGKLDLIRKNRRKIKKVLRRIYLDRAQKEHEETLADLARLVGLNNGPRVLNHEIGLDFDLKYTPSEAELESIIESYNSGGHVGGWEDVGFEFPANDVTGLEQKEWLSKSYAKTKASIDVEWMIPGQLLDMKKLKTVVTARRPDLLRSVAP